jgi:outer membrane immunogenic protein
MLATATGAWADGPRRAWIGFYAGINAGYGWSDRSVDFTGDNPMGGGAGNLILNFIDSGITNDSAYRSHHYSPDTRGFAGGGQIGYNWQLSRHWIGGLEVDLQGSGAEGDASITRTLGASDLRLSAEQRVKWFGTARARIGYLFGPRTLVFGTAGLAYGKTEAHADFEALTGGGVAVISNTNLGICTAQVCMSGSKTGTSVGWAAGAGIERALTDTVSFKAEYLHIDLGSETVRMVPQAPVTGSAFIDAKFKNAFDIVRVGLNVRF